MQGVMDLLYEEFRDTLVLVRSFITVPYSRLPVVNRSFVSDLLSKQGIAEEPSPETPVLSLVGTRGWEAEWNDPAASNGHLGIPLVSKAFVAQIPMVSRLLIDLGLGIDLGVEEGTTYRDDPRSHVRTFYVEDALQTVDSEGRKIIVNQEFSSKYSIKTVFGGGGPYVTMPQYVLAIIFFTTESVSMDIARAFEPFIVSIQDATARLLKNGVIF